MIAKKSIEKKFSWQDKILIGLLIVFNFFIFGFLLVANSRLFMEISKSREQYLVLDKQIKNLEQKNNELRELLLSTKSETQIEKFLREKALYKKEGEEVVVIKRNDKETARKVPQEVQETASVMDKFIDFLRELLLRD